MRGQRVELADVHVKVYEPRSGSAKGVTILLGGAMIPISSYGSITNHLVHDRENAVIGMFFNVFTTSHEDFEQQVHDVYVAYLAWTQLTFPAGQRYGIVGHSAGGKVALVLANRANEPVANVVAFDPVDLNPTVFTNRDSSKNQDFSSAVASSITMTWASGTIALSIPPAHNAKKVHEATDGSSSKLQPLVIDEGANHMAYTDNEGFPVGFVMVGGDKDFSAVEDTVYDLLDKNF